jgi:hypothetical protein
MIDYAAILNRKYKDAEWTLNGDDYEGLTWLSDSSKPTKSVLDALWDEVQNEMALEKSNKDAARQALYEKIGLTADELAALLA